MHFSFSRYTPLEREMSIVETSASSAVCFLALAGWVTEIDSRRRRDDLEVARFPYVVFPVIHKESLAVVNRFTTL